MIERPQAMMTVREPDLVEVVSLAAEFGVRKEATARGYVEASRHTLVAIVTRHGRIERVYRQPDVFPWIEPGRGAQVPSDSIAVDDPPAIGGTSEIAESDPDVWLSEYSKRNVDALTEQVMWQSQPCPAIAREVSRDALVSILGRPIGKRPEGYILVGGPSLALVRDNGWHHLPAALHRADQDSLCN